MGGQNISGVEGIFLRREEYFCWAALQRLHNGCVNELKPFIGLPTQPVLVRIEPKLDVWMSAKETDASANASTCPTRRKGTGRPVAKSLQISLRPAGIGARRASPPGAEFFEKLPKKPSAGIKKPSAEKRAKQPSLKAQAAEDAPAKSAAPTRRRPRSGAI